MLAPAPPVGGQSSEHAAMLSRGMRVRARALCFAPCPLATTRGSGRCNTSRATDRRVRPRPPLFTLDPTPVIVVVLQDCSRPCSARNRAGIATVGPTEVTDSATRLSIVVLLLGVGAEWDSTGGLAEDDGPMRKRHLRHQIALHTRNETRRDETTQTYQWLCELPVRVHLVGRSAGAPAEDRSQPPAPWQPSQSSWSR